MNILAEVLRFIANKIDKENFAIIDSCGKMRGASWKEWKTR
jgi:hypothetical protein